ncbi:MAG: hypothetical protein ACJ8EF_10595 [Bradyrhizobium sp.]|jgi:hypothetical protein
MYVIELFLPLYDNQGRRFRDSLYEEVRRDLIEKFGGITAFTRAPAQGSEQAHGGERRDDLIVFEVMTQELDALWWKSYRQSLETAFDQDQLIARAARVTLL